MPDFFFPGAFWGERPVKKRNPAMQKWDVSFLPSQVAEIISSRKNLPPPTTQKKIFSFRRKTFFRLRLMKTSLPPNRPTSQPAKPPINFICHLSNPITYLLSPSSLGHHPPAHSSLILCLLVSRDPQSRRRLLGHYYTLSSLSSE